MQKGSWSAPAKAYWAALGVVLAALLLGLAGTWYDGPVPQLKVLDARFYFGYDHLALVAQRFASSLSLAPLAATLGWLLLNGWRRLRGRPSDSLSMLVLLLIVVQLFEVVVVRIFVRDTGSKSNEIIAGLVSRSINFETIALNS